MKAILVSWSVWIAANLVVVAEAVAATPLSLTTVMLVLRIAIEVVVPVVLVVLAKARIPARVFIIWWVAIRRRRHAVATMVGMLLVVELVVLLGWHIEPGLLAVGQRAWRVERRRWWRH